jgi:DNA-binding CsgD family transcriptional regulator
MSFTVELHTKLRRCALLHCSFFFSPALPRYPEREVAAVATPYAFRLTPREQQIVAALRRGYTTRQIADAHGLGRQTVKNYLTTIYEKLGVSGRVELQQTAASGGSAPQHL